MAATDETIREHHLISEALFLAFEAQRQELEAQALERTPSSSSTGFSLPPTRSTPLMEATATMRNVLPLT